MSTNTNRIELIQTIVHKAKSSQTAHLSTEDSYFNGKEFVLNGNRLINFASCSYLGLACHEKLSQGAIEGIRKYGNSFPTSRSFVSMGYLESLEAELEKVFQHPVLVTTSTSLGHIAWLPLLVEKEDVVILDHQVHNSVSTASELLKSKGAKVEVVRHNHLGKLEERIVKYAKEEKKVWYLGDGVYSMYGDVAPVKELNELLETYPNFHVYLDDAHGMSWTGKNGCGYVLSQGPLHPRMALITSLGKGFGSLGGAMIFPNQEAKAHAKACAGPLIFSSPMVPAVIGASIASAHLHQSPDLAVLQSRLLDRMLFFKEKAEELGLPIIGKGETPIFFIPVGSVDMAFALGQIMMGHGFYQSLSVFPSVPLNNSGLRYTVTTWIEKEDIERMLNLLAMERKKLFERFDYSEKKLKVAFRRMTL